MKQIHITRDDPDHATFEPVNIDPTENVFFTNMDPDDPHKPSILKLGTGEQLGTYPSPNSSQVPVPPPQVTNPKPPPPTIAQAPPYQVPYTCEIPDTKDTKHTNEKGFINVYAPLAAINAAVNTALKATKGHETNHPVVVGGMPPYTITDLIVNSKKIPGSSTGPHQRLTIGIGLQLIQDKSGFIYVFGTPRRVETYNFTFTVDDSMGRNLQQVQYSLTVTAI